MKRPSNLPDTNGVIRHRLRNGATVLIKEDHSNPVVSLNLWIEAGSVDERPDERGMAHLIEHMIFKGTPSRPVGEISRAVEAAGGYLNAFTSYEHTCFYVVLPSDRIEKALDVEFDAYLNSTFDSGELAKEKEVVFEEMRMRRDDPWSWSWEILFRTLYKKSPYHWPVIGDMDILRGVPREKLMSYYRKHYVPSNTVIAIVGDISAFKVIRWLEKNFEGARRPHPPKRSFSFDPEPRSLKLHLESGDVQQGYLSLAYPTVHLAHSDAPALEVLDAILGEGPASRLNLSIREKTQSADEVGTESFMGKYGGAFIFQALTDAKRSERFVVDAMAELRRLIVNGVSTEELAKVKSKIKASKVFEKQSVDGQAKTLGFWELQGDYRFEERFLNALDAVTSSDLQRVAKHYFEPQRATFLFYHPKSMKFHTGPAHWQKLLEKGLDGAVEMGRKRASSASGVKKMVLANGSTLLVKERRDLPIVSVGMYVRGGFVAETNRQQGITNLMTKCLLKGTRRKTNEVFSREIEGLAAHLDPLMEKDYWGMVLEVLRDNLDKSLDLLMETAFDPLFSAEEVAKERKLQVAAIKRLKDDPAEYAMLRSDVLTFVDTPYSHMPMGTLETVSTFTHDHLRNWHSRHLNPRNITWMVVGDIEAIALKRLLESKLPVHSAPGVKGKSIWPLPLLRVAELKLPSESQQANIVLGYRAPLFGTSEYFGFRVLNTILNGMGGRLFVELREKKSLAYSVYASHDAGAAAGAYQLYIGCAPQKAEQAKRELLKVIQGLASREVPREELERAKTYLIGLHQVGQQSNRAQLMSYARHELVGKGAPVLDRFPDLIRQVSATDIRRLAQKYLMTSNRSWVTLAPRNEGRKP